MGNQQLKTAFYNQLNKGKEYLKDKNYKASFYHFENAHVLGQKHLLRHTISHYWMLIYGFKTKKSKEVIGQIARILASILFTLIWVPEGNTGGTNISAVKQIPIRKELKNYFAD